MSRRSQDIPIRPRYGYDDEPNDVEQSKTVDDTIGNMTTVVANKFSGSIPGDHGIMTSSYSEIPFLAQYSEPDDSLNVSTPITDDPPQCTHRSDSVEANDDDDEDDVEENDSKGSSCETRRPIKRPDSLQYGESMIPYQLEGSVRHEGQMLHFVASNMEHTLKTASPVTRKDINHAIAAGYASRNSTPTTSIGLLTRQFLQSQLPHIDANVLNDIEIEAQYLATSVDNVTENLCNLLHSISSITADNVEVHKNAVSKLTDSMDANIKCMYTIMAKTEEISKSMKPTEQLGQRIREIKRLVDMLESNM